MALEDNIQTVSYEASGAIPQYTLVMASTAGPRRVQPATAQAVCIGSVNNAPAALGHAATVVIAGIAKVRAGAAITVGALVASNATGQAVPGATNPVGIAITAAAAANEIVEVQLQL